MTNNKIFYFTLLLFILTSMLCMYNILNINIDYIGMYYIYNGNNIENK